MLLRFGAAAFALLCFLLLADTPAIRFIDIAAQAGLTIPNTFGGKDRKDYILEAPAPEQLFSTTTETGLTTSSLRTEPRSTPTLRQPVRYSTATMAKVTLPKWVNRPG